LSDSQNFFTNVKAKMSESAARAAESDGKHHYDDKEQALMAE
jgi:cysteinyl-tRNA synthetase